MKPRRRPEKRSHRSLTREQELAHVICAAINEFGCSCDQAGAEPCAKLVWAAKRAMRHLGVAASAEREPA